ncbi:MAG: monofunctional biosynthetic peptidoglycan transglycosylase [Sulfuricurvum sp.]|uniref:monofunctional biosynthetic peptidoglycan transglycosylase n=1 Tax=Sulfuricurvum sp. TaxID=2025608 RepID=UPI002634FB4C|nr:monofunctional biosynthetic peptidoglycan transglycosylase [Sulfuricurvum sp.]MDD2368268.1 monofunctional biosynthetic peptidoglycan transglycosylase [Sulfuricurvum sp.]MDD2951401.1 monofunctional biosynthetic peptidoglycan transglycosylase [Sulfuricurvum sp.]MDD5119000.1 monofunctional biosynthetic peptidoglycan transglycosylase [Sulfuricurvum sp.]
MSKLKLFLLFLLIGGFIDIGRYLVYPNVSDLRDIHPIPTAFMEYREDQWASENRDMHITQKWVSISQISPNIIKAVLIGEDDKFWNHDGFDVNGMEQALERSLKKGSVAGGSTISQQLAKNLYLSPSKNPIRKIKEAILTWRIENTLTKRQILELYLNVAEWGDGIFGIEAAARHYYHKSAKNLTGLEAAHLAAVLPNPIRYNATGKQKYVANRSRIIYRIMKRRGIVIPQYQEVMTPPKKEETPTVNEEENQSISDLFTESNPSEPATENAGESDVPAENDTNSSMKF